MSNVIIDFGFLQISWYSVFIFVGILTAATLITTEAKRFNINKDFINNLIFWMVVFGIVGARLYYVAFNWSYYQNDLFSILKIWEGGLAIHGAIIGGLLFLIIYAKKYKVRISLLTDIFVVGALIGQAIGRWGNFFNQEAHGGEVARQFLENLHLPHFIIEGMKIGGVYYHPTFLYESLWCLVGFIILLLVRRNKYIKLGQITGLYFMWYSIGRFLIEALRTDSLMLGNFKMAQVFSIVLFLAGLIIVSVQSQSSKFENLYSEGGMKNGIKF